MSDIAIRIENLGKRYRYGGVAPLSANFRADLTEWARGLFARGDHRPKTIDHRLPATPSSEKSSVSSLKSGVSRDDEWFWALRDINLEIRRGEVVGIIGRNGAGKSTLLKILSRITPPTTGKITYHGRIASLLEVGTGFHRELTGRENIYLNGSILGMKRAEIAKKFDEIVAFAEVEKFIDTPVKFYSSGMYVRLAFAVAAHLDTDIMLVDEVLAVGDMSFQQKCLGKMGQVASTGRTVLFVSHNMNAVAQLCGRAILLEAGRTKHDDTASSVISTYLESTGAEARVDLNNCQHSGAQGFARLRQLELLDKDRKPTTFFIMNEPFVARITFECLKRTTNVEVGVKIFGRNRQRIHLLTSSWEGLHADLDAGTHVFEVVMPHILVFPGTYLVGTWIKREMESVDDEVLEATTFTVLKGNVTGHPTWMERYNIGGTEVYAPSQWRIIGSD